MAKFYAVARGYKLGIFDDFKKCEESTSGYSNSLFKTFNNRESAKEWLEQNGVEMNNDFTVYNKFESILKSFDALELVECFKILSTFVGNEYENCKANIIKEQEKQQDLLHVIELTNFNASNGFKTYKQLQEVRQTRRYYKDRVSELEFLNNFIKNNNILSKLHKVSDEITSKKQFQETRIYEPRQLKELGVIKNNGNITPNSKTISKKLEQVNHTNIKFKHNSTLSKLDELFLKIKSS